MNGRLLPFCLLMTGAKQTGIRKDLAADNVGILLQHEAAQVHTLLRVWVQLTDLVVSWRLCRALVSSSVMETTISWLDL